MVCPYVHKGGQTATTKASVSVHFGSQTVPSDWS